MFWGKNLKTHSSISIYNSFPSLNVVQCLGFCNYPSDYGFFILYEGSVVTLEALSVYFDTYIVRNKHVNKQTTTQQKGLQGIFITDII